MRRLAALVVAVMMAGGIALATTAAPAQANPPSYPNATLQGVYYDRDFCYWYGSYGIQNGMWDFYICDQYNSFWFLHSFKY